MNKYQTVLDKFINDGHRLTHRERHEFGAILQELVDKETPLTPEYKLTKMEYKTHYLDKDYEMKYHCPKCDSIVFPISRCDKCNQNLNWNKYYIIEEKYNGRTYYKRSDTDE